MRTLSVFMLIVAIVLLGFGIFCYKEGVRSGAGYDWSVPILSLCFGISLLIGGVILLGFGIKKAVKAYKICPKCAEKIKKEAMICKHCNYKF